MNRDQMKELLRRPAEAARHTISCPDDYQVASYIDGGLSEGDHSLFELHLDECDYCIERVGLLGRARESEIEATVPEMILARSRRLAGGASRQQARTASPPRWRNAPRWAAAAVVVLLLGFLAGREFPETAAPESDHQVRTIDLGALAPRVIFPEEGATVDPGNLIFNWTMISDSLYYQVRIVNDEGDLVWQERVAGTQWKLPSGLSLSPGAEYFVRVDSYLAEARSLNSDYLVFRIEGRR